MSNNPNQFNATPTDNQDNPWADLENMPKDPITTTEVANPAPEASTLDASETPATTTETTQTHENLINVNIKNLSPEDDFSQVAKSLYLVDQYIFPDLFGDEEKAKTFAPALFSDDPDALFSYNKTLVAKDDDGNIAGIIVYRDAECTPWDTTAVTERFAATGIELPENFVRANENYMKKITDAELPEGAVEIEFVGVRNEYRGSGIGSKLIASVLDSPEYTEAHLDVLDSHPGARSLYDKLGFMPDGDKFPNYPDGSEGVQHMILKKSEQTPETA